MGEQWKEEMFTSKYQIKVRVIQDGRPTVQASALITPPTYNSLPVLWIPPSQVQSAAGAEAGISISEAGEDKDTAVPQSSHSLFVLAFV